MAGGVVRRIYEIHAKELIRDDMEEILAVMLFNEHLFQLFVHLAFFAMIAVARIVSSLIISHCKLSSCNFLPDILATGSGLNTN